MIDFTECDAGQETLDQEVEQFRRALMEELHRNTKDLLQTIEAIQRRFAAFAQMHAGFDPAKHHISYELRRLHQQKTMAGLLRMFRLHRLRKASLTQHPVKLHRVRRITATHPSIAPPQVA